MLAKIKQIIMGKPKNPLSPSTKQHIALIALLAWIGLGADGLSSACYGPEQAFLALGIHYHLAFFLALTTAGTVFLIALAYNQVIRLFPNGGGGYKVATELLGPYAGLISGAALLIDYMLTIAISIASGIDAMFSLLPLTWQSDKIYVEIIILTFLLLINLRGAKESIKVLMPIFLGFFITHAIMIILGISLHGRQLPLLIHSTLKDTHSTWVTLGWLPFLALFMRAYSMGGGTYTGIEAVSNNVNILAEPRVKTGKLTMLYMALSLSFTAGGIILLYLLWHAQHVPGQTLNAVVFSKILAQWPQHHVTLLILMLFEAGILLVAANTGFLGGPTVLANMALDRWVPKRFRALSSRLVTQNGIVLFAVCAGLVLIWTDGSVNFLVVLYSMNVFLTFSISILGLCKYWWNERNNQQRWYLQLLFASLAFLLCAAILIITLIEKFDLGGWITVFITGGLIMACILIRRHYFKMRHLKKQLDQELELPLKTAPNIIPAIDKNAPTAVFLVKNLGAAMHTLLWVQRMFPNHFKNFLFISHGVVDIGCFGSEEKTHKLTKDNERILNYLIKFSQQYNIAADSFMTFGTDPVSDIEKLAAELNAEYPQIVYFSSRYVYPTENWITRILHGDIATILQRRLQRLGIKMLIVPLNLKISQTARS